MTGKIEDLQKALDIIEQFCFSLDLRLISKRLKFVFLALEEPAHLTCRFMQTSNHIAGVHTEWRRPPPSAEGPDLEGEAPHKA